MTLKITRPSKRKRLVKKLDTEIDFSHMELTKVIQKLQTIVDANTHAESLVLRESYISPTTTYDVSITYTETEDDLLIRQAEWDLREKTRKINNLKEAAGKRKRDKAMYLKLKEKFEPDD